MKASRKSSRKKDNLVILGAGGHAKVVIDLLEKQNYYRIVGLVAPSRKEEVEVCGYPLLPAIPKGIRLGLVAIGDNWRRARAAESVIREDPRFNFITAIHPAAVVSRGVSIGAGSVVMAGACINTDAHIGQHVIINTRCSVDHECRIGNFASIGPGAAIGGKTKIGEYSAVGIGATVIHEVSVGDHVVIGAGGVVVNDLEDSVLAFGNPCRAIRRREKGEPYLATKR